MQLPPYKAVWGATKCGCVPEGRLGSWASSLPLRYPGITKASMTTGTQQTLAELRSQRPGSLGCLSPSAI